VVDEALEAGVSGYVFKSGHVEELVGAIELVMAGKIYLSPDISASIVEDYTKVLRGELKSGKLLLSERERLLLRLVAEGLRNKEIAAELAISLKSVEARRARLMAKLGCASSSEMVRYAVREGIAVP